MHSIQLSIAKFILVVTCLSIFSSVVFAQVPTRITKGGHLAATTEAKFDKAMEILVSGDKVAFIAYINANADVIVLKQGLEVYIVDTKIFSGKVKIRLKGTTLELWTVIEAI